MHDPSDDDLNPVKGCFYAVIFSIIIYTLFVGAGFGVYILFRGSP